MTKKDLKNGMILETREGTRYLYCEGVMRGLDAWDLISNYTDNLKNTVYPQLDIVKFYEDTKEYDLSTIFKYKYLKLIWQRPETPKLSEREIEILKASDVLGYKYIARDRNSNIYAYYFEPKKLSNSNVAWVGGGLFLPIKTDLFAFITWVDEKPTSIQELLSDFEKEKKDE